MEGGGRAESPDRGEKQGCSADLYVRAARGLGAAAQTMPGARAAVVSDSGSSVRSVESLTLAGSTGWRSALHGGSHLLSKGLAYFLRIFFSAGYAIRRDFPASTSVRRFTSYLRCRQHASDSMINQTGKSPLQKTSNGPSAET